MNNIDILEEKEKKAIEYLKLVAKERIIIPLCDDIKILLNLLETLIAENKEKDEEIENQDKTIDRLVKEQEEREKYTHQLEAENKELKEENRFLKTHEYKSKCECCKEYFYHKRPNVLWCKKCRTKMYNINYYANLSEEKKRERAEKSKIAMRKKRNLQYLLGKE